MLEGDDRLSGKSSKEGATGPRAVQIPLEFFVTWPKSGSASCVLHKVPSFHCLVTENGNPNCLEEQGTVKELDFVAVKKQGVGEREKKRAGQCSAYRGSWSTAASNSPSTKFQATILFLWEIMQVSLNRCKMPFL